MSAEGRLEALPVPFASTAPLAAGSLATDAQSNLYVCTESGVQVRIGTSGAPHKLCWQWAGGWCISFFWGGSGR